MFYLIQFTNNLTHILSYKRIEHEHTTNFITVDDQQTNNKNIKMKRYENIQEDKHITLELERR